MALLLASSWLGEIWWSPSLLTDTCLDGLDWDTIPGLFDHLDEVKMTHIDFEIASSRWLEESFDIFNLDDDASHNLAVALFLTPNTQPWVELSNDVIRNFIFSAVVMYKPMAQSTCSLWDTISKLCEFARDKTPAIALISLSEAASYFPYPNDEDRIDYAIVPVDNEMTRVVWPMSAFLVGWLLHVIDDTMHIILPPAFRLDAEARDFDWVPHPVQGNIWANYQLVDPDSDENFTHMVPVAPSNVFQTDPGDKVWWSALGIHLVSPHHPTYKKDLTQYGQEVVTKFISAFYQAKNP